MPATQEREVESQLGHFEARHFWFTTLCLHFSFCNLKELYVKVAF